MLAGMDNRVKTLTDTPHTYDTAKMAEFVSRLAAEGVHASDAMSAISSQFALGGADSREIVEASGHWEAELAQSAVLKDLFLNLLDEDDSDAA